MRLLARIAVSVAAAIAYTFAFSAVTLVVFALTHDESPPPTTSWNGSITLWVEADPMPTWVASLYLAGVVFLVGFRLWRERTESRRRF